MKLRLALAAADASAQSTVALYGLIENGISLGGMPCKPRAAFGFGYPRSPI